MVVGQSEPNILRLKDEACEKTANSKCKFWTYVPTRNICFIVSGSCLEKSEEGSISGEKGCVVPSSKFSVHNLFTDKSAKTILVEWENSGVCPNVEIAEIEKSKSVTYLERSDSLKCGKLKKVTYC